MKQYLFLTATLLVGSVVVADSAPFEGATDTDVRLIQQISTSMKVEVEVGLETNRVPIAHCREAGSPARGRGAWYRCMRRLRIFATHFVRAQREYGTNAWTLAAMARQESGYNPFATGPIGEGGILQLHPRGIGSHARFVRDPAYRAVCARRAGACQARIVQLAAHHFQGWLERCDSKAEALGGYNSGHCQENAYSRNVERIQERLMSLHMEEESGDAS